MKDLTRILLLLLAGCVGSIQAEDDGWDINFGVMLSELDDAKVGDGNFAPGVHITGDTFKDRAQGFDLYATHKLSDIPSSLVIGYNSIVFKGRKDQYQSLFVSAEKLKAKALYAGLKTDLFSREEFSAFLNTDIGLGFTSKVNVRSGVANMAPSKVKIISRSRDLYHRIGIGVEHKIAGFTLRSSYNFRRYGKDVDTQGFDITVGYKF